MTIFFNLKCQIPQDTPTAEKVLCQCKITSSQETEIICLSNCNFWLDIGYRK